MIEEGMVVQYTPQWRTPGEYKCLMVVLKAYHDIKKYLVRHINSGLSIAPIEMVSFEMIQPASFNAKDYFAQKENDGNDK